MSVWRRTGTPLRTSKHGPQGWIRKIPKQSLKNRRLYLKHLDPLYQSLLRMIQRPLSLSRKNKLKSPVSLRDNTMITLNKLFRDSLRQPRAYKYRGFEKCLLLVPTLSHLLTEIQEKLSPEELDKVMERMRIANEALRMRREVSCSSLHANRQMTFLRKLKQMKIVSKPTWPRKPLAKRRIESNATHV